MPNGVLETINEFGASNFFNYDNPVATFAPGHVPHAPIWAQAVPLANQGAPPGSPPNIWPDAIDAVTQGARAVFAWGQNGGIGVHAVGGEVTTPTNAPIFNGGLSDLTFPRIAAVFAEGGSGRAIYATSDGEAIETNNTVLALPGAYANNANAPGVIGYNVSDTEPAVAGLNEGNGSAVQAYAGGSGAAVQAQSASGIGVHAVGGGASVTDFPQGFEAAIFAEGGPGGAGVWCTTSGTGTALTALATGDVAGGASAGFFEGNVLIIGDLQVTGAKSAVVPFPDGSHRRTYCMESPESWFEDFGFGEYVNGLAQIQLDPEFAAVVDSDAYHVFLTEYDDNNALYVTQRTSTGFEVRAKASTASGTFSYRVVAKRKDNTPPRLEKVTIPRHEKVTIPRREKATTLTEKLQAVKSKARAEARNA